MEMVKKTYGEICARPWVPFSPDEEQFLMMSLFKILGTWVYHMSRTCTLASRRNRQRRRTLILSSEFMWKLTQRQLRFLPCSFPSPFDPIPSWSARSSRQGPFRGSQNAGPPSHRLV